MRYQKLSADLIFTNTGSPLTKHLIILDQNGTIIGLDPLENHDPASVQIYQGALVPGFVNAHCHLELSHMLGLIPTGTGLLDFIENVVRKRDIDPQQIDDAIRRADHEMWHNGIVAVGDISNTANTFSCKQQSKMFYHTFVEMFDLMSTELTQKTYEQYLDVYEEAPSNGNNTRSAVPHAPYSVSPELFGLINNLNENDTAVSIHALETQSEIDLFKGSSGAFPALFQSLGASMDALPSGYNSPLRYLLDHLDPRQRTLLVHNTLVTAEDLEIAQRWSGEIYWVTCPNANLYIENRLPRYSLLQEQQNKVCLGTDSLTSNWQLSIFEEMRTVAKYQSKVTTEELVRWSSLHGACALGIDHIVGSIEVGKRPGINLLQLNNQIRIDEESSSQKIV